MSALREGGRWTAIAPGRVNLIGEHTDYNGLAVLPIAIDRDVRIDFRVVDEPVVRLGNTAACFAPFAFRVDKPIGRAPQGDWSNYVRAAAFGLLEHSVELKRGIEGTVAGSVPMASGLASSSALVVASALALLKANGVAVGGEPELGGELGSVGCVAGRSESAPTRLELAALMARAERFVGLEGGGMDQAACLHGVPGHALRIDFDPLRVVPVPVPEAWRWVVASSLVRAEKSRGVRAMYNERVKQCREALREAEGVAPTGSVRGPIGRAEGGGRTVGSRHRSLTYRDLVADDDLAWLMRSARRALDPVLFRRLRHVVTEGRRIALAEAAMRDGDMGRFGDLMVQSHESLRDDYEVSTEELNAIVTVMLEAGAAGARLTGAGFGGCAVALCDPVTVGVVTEALASRFYMSRLGRPPTSDETFVAKPAESARIERSAA